MSSAAAAVMVMCASLSPFYLSLARFYSRKEQIHQSQSNKHSFNNCGGAAAPCLPQLSFMARRF
jgi:hypothetical protein